MMSDAEAYDEALREWRDRFLGGAVEPSPPLPPGFECPCVHCVAERIHADKLLRATN